MFPDGVKTIEDTQARAILPNGPPLYEIDALTDRNERYVPYPNVCFISTHSPIS